MSHKRQQIRLHFMCHALCDFQCGANLKCLREDANHEIILF